MAKPGPIRVVAASEAQEAPGALVPSSGSELDRKMPLNPARSAWLPSAKPKRHLAGSAEIVRLEGKFENRFIQLRQDVSRLEFALSQMQRAAA
jgi:hypothetical protein